MSGVPVGLGGVVRDFMGMGGFRDLAEF